MSLPFNTYWVLLIDLELINHNSKLLTSIHPIIIVVPYNYKIYLGILIRI